MKYKLNTIVQETDKRCEPKTNYGKIIRIDTATKEYRVRWKLGSHSWHSEERITEMLAPKNWDTLCEGDVVVDESGCERKVLAVIGEVVFTSDTEDLDAASDYRTKKELQDRGYTIKTTEEPDETDFVCCDTCCKKPLGFKLCDGCIKNKATIEALKNK